jgi:hypothetical protein
MISSEFEQYTVTTARIFPSYIAEIITNYATGATFQAAVGDQHNTTVAFCRIAAGGAAHRALLGSALGRADFRILDLDMWAFGIDTVTVLEQLFFDLGAGAHSKALHSL